MTWVNERRRKGGEELIYFTRIEENFEMNEAIEIRFVRGCNSRDKNYWQIYVVNCKSTKINKFKSLLLEYISQKYIELFVIRVFAISRI